MWKCGFLADEVTTTGNTMFQRDRFDLGALVLVNHLTNLRIYRMKLHLKTQIVGIKFDLMVEFRSQRFWCMDMKGSRAPQKSEGGNHADESKAVVAM